MKYPFKIGFFLLIIMLLSYIFSCTNDNPISPESNNLINKIDMEQLHKKLLSDFELIRTRGRWREGREYVFIDKMDRTKNVFIRIGIHPSIEETKEIANEYNSWCSIVPQEDFNKNLDVGDQLWWMPDPNSTDTVSYHFIQKNVFIIVNSHTLNYNELFTLTKSIDADIKNHESYISFSKSANPPIINTITSSKLKLIEGDTTKIIIDAIDPNNEDLEYITIGVSQWNEDPKNVFTLVASRDFIPEPFYGTHTFEFIVINESNFVSRIEKIELEISN